MSLSKEFTAGILGATGMIGIQLLTFLSDHPNVNKILPFSRKAAGKKVSQEYAVFKGLLDMKFEEYNYDKLLECDVIFLALPHGESFNYVSDIIKSNVRCIDVSSDFRFKSATRYESVYGKDHPYPKLAEEITAIVPEINGRDCMDKSYVSMYGCTSSLTMLSLYPLLKSELLVDDRVIIDAKLPSSGGVRSEPSPSQLHYSRSNSVNPYRLLHEHRHNFEIADFFESISPDISKKIFLNTHSIDLTRGISAAIYFSIKENVTETDIRKAYRKWYKDEPFIRIIKQFSGQQRYPNPKYVSGTNFTDIGFSIDTDKGTGVVIAACDNLIKGGAGQAIQVFNIQQGLPVETGLKRWPQYP